jgi:hypothetical protein
MAKKTTKQEATTKAPTAPSASPTADDPGTIDEYRKLVAASLTDGVVLNAMTAVTWSSPKDGRDKVDSIRAAGNALEAAGTRVRAGDLGAAESLLMAQAVALNAMFAKFADMAHHTEYVDQLEQFTRLALRAQSQCARTLEVLGGLKNPTVIAKQANVALTQQVINGPVQQVARVDLTDPAQNRLLGEANVELARMEHGAPREGARGDSPLEAVAVEHGAPKPRGQSPSSPEREQGHGGAP